MLAQIGHCKATHLTAQTCFEVDHVKFFSIIVSYRASKPDFVAFKKEDLDKKHSEGIRHVFEVMRPRKL